MINMMNPSYVSNFWNGIYDMLEPSLLSYNPDENMKLNLLKGIVSGIFQCWLCYRDNVGVGLVLTMVNKDMINGDSSLVIIGVVGNNSNHNDWKDGIKSLISYAKNRGCSRVTAFVEDDGITNILDALGANSDTRFVYWEVN